MACLRLVTLPPLPPLPLLSVPPFLRRIALSTRLLAALRYFRAPVFFRPPRFLAAISGSRGAGPTADNDERRHGFKTRSRTDRVDESRRACQVPRRGALLREHLWRIATCVKLGCLQHRHAEAGPRKPDQDSSQDVRRIMHAEVDPARTDRDDHERGKDQRQHT